MQPDISNPAVIHAKAAHTSSNPNRRLPRKIRYSTIEWATLVERAQACSVPPATYARLTSLSFAVPVRRGRADAELVRQLARIGNNLNQLARVANDVGQLPTAVALRRTLDEILELVRRLR